MPVKPNKNRAPQPPANSSPSQGPVVSPSAPVEKSVHPAKIMGRDELDCGCDS